MTERLVLRFVPGVNGVWSTMMRRPSRLPLAFAVALLLLVSCTETDTPPALVTFEDLVSAGDELGAIAPRLDEIVQDTWSTQGEVDAESVASAIASLPQVSDARVAETGTTVIATVNGGAIINIPLLRMNDEDAFAPVGTTSLSSKVDEAGERASRLSEVAVSEFPVGDRALILGPVRSEFGILQWNPADHERILTNAGFVVDAYYDADASIDKFTGDFLRQYDVVVIYTHGFVGSTLFSAAPATTALLTGTPMSAIDADFVDDVGSAVEFLATMPYGFKGQDPDSFLAVTPQFIRGTTTGTFDRRTYLLAIACESAKLDLGSSSLAATIIDLGAGGFSGYTEPQNVRLASSQSKFLLTRLGGGDSLATATDAARGDPGLTAISWIAKLVNLDLTVSAQLLYASQRLADPYYLVPPDAITASASTTPSFGPPGTTVAFEALVRDAHQDVVVSAVLEIDNTGERIDLVETTAGRWVPDVSLRAPTAGAYPRTDTFTFRGFDSVGGEQARALTYFTIMEPAVSAEGGLGQTNVGSWSHAR